MSGMSLAEECKDAKSVEALAAMRQAGAADVNFDAYYQGKSIFFGPALSMWFMFSNESALVFNLNVTFPTVVFQPSLGYAMGI
jgi:hypothetical protein